MESKVLTDDQRKARAENARRIFDDPLFHDFMVAAQDDIVSEWTRATTTEEKEAKHAEILGLIRIAKKIKSVVDDGALVAKPSRKVL